MQVELADGQLALLAPSWDCDSSTRSCSTILDGETLEVKWSTLTSTLQCTASYAGKPIPCHATYWYAPMLKPFIQVGRIPNLSVPAAILERPWRLLDQWCLGESGPLPPLAGLFSSLTVAVGVASVAPRQSWWRLRRVPMAGVVLAGLNVAWFLMSIWLGYVD